MKLRTVAKDDVQHVVNKMFQLFADLNLNSDTVFCALQVSIETMEEQFGYSLEVERKGGSDGH